MVFAAFAASAADAKTPAAKDLPALFSVLEKTDAVAEGSTSPTRILYVFFDANCWYCHLTWKALQPYEKAGLQVRWVPVAYQKESSTTKAAAIMLAKDRVAAMRENETGYRAQSYDGGIAPVKASKALEAQLEANFELMDRFSACPGRRGSCGRTRRAGCRSRPACRASRSCPRSPGSPRRRSTTRSSKSSASLHRPRFC
jgi:hypothetical protein